MAVGKSFSSSKLEESAMASLQAGHAWTVRGLTNAADSKTAPTQNRNQRIARPPQRPFYTNRSDSAVGQDSDPVLRPDRIGILSYGD